MVETRTYILLLCFITQIGVVTLINRKFFSRLTFAAILIGLIIIQFLNDAQLVISKESFGKVEIENISYSTQLRPRYGLIYFNEGTYFNNVKQHYKFNVIVPNEGEFGTDSLSFISDNLLAFEVFKNSSEWTTIYHIVDSDGKFLEKSNFSIPHFIQTNNGFLFYKRGSNGSSNRINERAAITIVSPFQSNNYNLEKLDRHNILIENKNEGFSYLFNEYYELKDSFSIISNFGSDNGIYITQNLDSSLSCLIFAEDKYSWDYYPSIEVILNPIKNSEEKSVFNVSNHDSLIYLDTIYNFQLKAFTSRSN